MSHNKGMSHRVKGMEWGIKGEAVRSDRLTSCVSELGEQRKQ
jgi:hypothetical protein